ncbi:phosphatase PAP2 family protein [Allobranchiibius huperziae]|uniref:Undecaprenyl-diphosphatase n=1 Tax=Allobranchiibius huperziae TaxID=1874116 RepID=A0A853DJI8_9MICO|nr:undecaprenyl-diphosphatase [Allobranchiibius huperziae]
MLLLVPARRRPGPAPERIDRRLLAWGASMVALGLLIGVWVTSTGARHTGEYALDADLSRHRNVAGVALARLVDVVGSPLVGPFLLLALAAVLWWLIDRGTAAWFLGLAIVGWFSVTVCKVAFHRHRPPTAAIHALVVEHGADSFPSGHTALAAGIVIGAAVAVRGNRAVRSWVLLVGIPLIALVGLTRLLLGAHYLGDVVGSPLIAGGAVLLTAGLLRPVEDRVRGRFDGARLPRGSRM